MCREELKGMLGVGVDCGSRVFLVVKWWRVVWFEWGVVFGGCVGWFVG